MKESLKTCFPFFLVFIFLTILVKDHCFFWDTLQLASRHAHWYFDNDFRYFFPPESIDSGHPPLFGMYLAFMWKMFGKTLWISHLSMLPFLLGGVYFLQYLGEYFLGKGKSIYLLLLATVDPFFLGQSIMVSPDIVLVFGWLMALWAILENRKFPLILATILLAMISMRGMMVVFSIFLFEIFRLYHQKITWKLFLQTFLKYVPSGLLSLVYLFLHYQHAGWIGYHEASPWAPTFEKVGFSGFIYNIGLVGWRLLDFGRVFLWIFIGWGFWKILKKKFQFSDKLKELVALLLVLMIVLSPSMLIHVMVKAHRYLLPVALVVDILALKILFKMIDAAKAKKIVFSFLFIGLLTGNLWVYPKHISQGWDSTFAHFPYYNLRMEMIHYLDENKIPLDSIGTGFPMIGELEYLDLNGRKDGFHEKDFVKDDYILYSNIFNDFSDEELAKLETYFTIEKAYHKAQICMILYKRKD